MKFSGKFAIVDDSGKIYEKALDIGDDAARFSTCRDMQDKLRECNHYIFTRFYELMREILNEKT